MEFATPRSALLRLGGEERRFTAGDPDAVLELVFRHLVDEIAAPDLRPVVAQVTGLPAGPVRMTVTPGGDGHHDHPADEPG